MLRAISQRVRFDALALLQRGPLSVGELMRALNVSESLMSAHLSVLRKHGLVEAERAGKKVLYRLAAHSKRNAIALKVGCCTLVFHRRHRKTRPIRHFRAG